MTSSLVYSQFSQFINHIFSGYFFVLSVIFVRNCDYSDSTESHRISCMYSGTQHAPAAEYGTATQPAHERLANTLP